MLKMRMLYEVFLDGGLLVSKRPSGNSAIS
jgi:hypothetical protein